MKGFRKLYAWTLIGSGISLIILGTLLFISSRIIKNEQVIGKINALMSETIRGDVVFEKIGISYLPRPRLKINGCRIKTAEKNWVVIPALIVTPRLLPLFIGQFQVAAATVQMPEIEWHPPAGERDPAKFTDMLKKMAAVISTASTIPDGFSLRIYGGRFTAIGDGSPLFTLRHLNLRITRPENKALLDFQCKSDRFNRMAFKGSIDPHNLHLQGELNVKALRLPSFGIPFERFDGLMLTGSPMDLTLAITTQGLHSLKANFSGVLPGASLTRGQETFVIETKRFSGKLQLNKNRSTLLLTELVVDHPRMVISGNLDVGPIHAVAFSPAHLEITARDADIGSTRQAVGFAAGTDPVVKTVLDIVRNGRVPYITMTSSGAEPSELGKMENMLFRGSITDGKLHIPDTGLDPEAVNGNVTISKNFLKGSNLIARYGATTGTNGSLTMVWEKQDTLFDLDIDVDANLAQLPPLLKQWIDDNQFDDEMNLLTEVVGRAKGKLMLSGTTEDILTRADVQEFNLSLKYKRFPHFIKIEKGRCSLHPTGIKELNINGKTGKSLFSGINAEIDWKDETFLTIHSGAIELQTEEVDPWIRSFEDFHRYRETIKKMDGMIAFDSVRLAGPMFIPIRWDLDLKGRANHLAVQNPQFSKPLDIESGRFRIIEKEGLSSAIFQEFQLDLMGNPLRLTGWLKNYFGNADKGGIHFEGEVHPEIIDLVYRQLGVGSESLPPAPRSRLSVTNGQLVWTKGEKTRFAGTLAVANGPEAKIDLFYSPDAFRVDRLEIRDRESKATLRYSMTEESMGIGFSGYLTARTLDAFFADYPDPFKRGWLQGEIKIDIDRKAPLTVTGEGDVKGRHIFFPEFIKTPLKIDAIALNVLEDRFMFERAEVIWKGNSLRLKGTVEHPDRFWRTDLALAADVLDWRWINEAIDKLKGASYDSTTRFQELPVRGNVEIIADRFVFGELEWKPLNADIVMSRDGIEIAFAKAYQCGIDSPGVVTIKGEKISLEALPYAKDLDLQPVLDCLEKDAVLATGKVDITGQLSSVGTPEDLLSALEGTLEFNIRNGRIYRHIPLARLFTFLDLVEILKKINPSIEKEGFPFRHILINCRIEGGKMIIEEGLLDSPIMELALQGNVDLVSDRIDLDVLAAPMQSINYLIKKMPMVGQVMGGTLISIPLKIEGHWDDPKVTVLPHKMVSEGLIRIMKRILKLPFTMIEPMIPDP